MKKFTKALILALACLMLFASCAPEPEPAPQPEPEKEKPAPHMPNTAVNTRADDGSWVMNYELDPDHPYDATHYGLFHDQIVSVSAGRNKPSKAIGKYSLYIPQGFQPKHQAFIILIPDDTTAKEFALGPIGQDWIAASKESKTFAVVFAEPNGKWNVACEKGPNEAPLRDDAYFLDKVFSEIRKKNWIEGGNAFLSVDKNGASILGYEEGASMAAIVAASFPATFANTTLVNPTSFDADKVNAILDQEAIRHAGDTEHTDEDFHNRDIAMPMNVYVDDSADPAVQAAGDAIVECWTAVNENAKTKVEDSTFMPELAVAKKVDDGTPAALAKLAQNNGRYLGYAGGTLRTRPDYNDDRFDLYDGVRIIGDEKLRRFRTYTPTTEWPVEKEERPLVVVLHGSSSAITDICEESRWTDLADKHGFEVVFIQGYPKASSATGAMIPSWNLGDYTMENDDINYILEVVRRVTKIRNTDPARVYLTGHSLGSMMTRVIMNSPAADQFAAFAPIGSFDTPQPSITDTEIALWAMSGEWEFGGKMEYMGQVFNMPTVDENAEEWAARFDGLEKSEPVFEEDYGNSKKYKTWSFTNKDGISPVKVTKVMDSPHTYMAEESMMLWDWFKDYSRNTETKELLYKGKPIKAPAAEK